MPVGGESCDTGCATGYHCQCDDAACEARHCMRWRYPGESCGEPGDRCLAGDCTGGVCRTHGERGLFANACGGADAGALP